MMLSSLNEVRLIVFWKETNNFDEINNFFMNNDWNKIENFVKLMWKSQWDVRIFAISLIYIRCICEKRNNRRSRHYPWTQSRFRNYRMIFIVWMTREIFKMLNRYAVDNPTLPVNLRFSHFFKIFAEWWAVIWECWDATMGHQVFGTRLFFRETFLQIQRRFFSAPYLQESNLWESNVSEYTSRHVMSENQKPVQDQRCQSGPSARNSFVPSVVGFSKNYGADQQRLQISDLHLDKFTSRLRYVFAHNFLRKPTLSAAEPRRLQNDFEVGTC